jgi:hypothetical protein
MNEVALTALAGSNPLGFLAALGTLDAVAAALPDATLHWTDDVVPQAILGGIGDPGAVLDALDADRETWNGSVLLSFPEASPLPDAKPDTQRLRQWFETVARTDTGRAASDHLCALVAEGAFDGNGGKAKPTHLHFTAGQQQFLSMVRTLARDVDRERLHEALFGPWAYDSPLPSLSWDVRGERIYALRGTKPSSEKRLGVPGADWLAFRGLVFYPVARTSRGTLYTTACDADWKRGAFRWPIWSAPCTRNVTMSLVADETLVSASRRTQLRPGELTARGIISVLEAPIRRNDQGGYGSFSGPESLGG